MPDAANRHGLLPPDYHLHTALCGHAEGTPAEYKAVAGKLGLPAICFTDHMPSFGGYNEPHRMRPAQFPEYEAQIRALQKSAGPEVLFGIEADYFEGCEKEVGRFLSENRFDLVIGSIHLLDQWVFDDPAARGGWENADVAGIWRRYFALLTRAAQSRLYDIVGHIDLPKKFGHRIGDELLRELAAPALDAVAQAGMAIEINTSGWRKPVAEQYPSTLILQMMKERRIPITFGSDAHRPEEVGYEFQRAVKLAHQAGFREYCVFSKRKKILRALNTETQPGNLQAQ